MIDISEKKEQCCGCTACYSICPKNAISMVEDEKGFKYPKVDKELCVQCGLCDKVCAFSRKEQFSFGDEPIAAYAIKHKDEDVRKNSRSGGVFTAITDYVLQQNGCIYGAVMDKAFVVKHVKAENMEQRNQMRGSKYVQSDMTDVFRDVKKELLTGRLVVFSGTGCQVAGLRSYLMKDYDNLIAIDLVCHGVPSPLVWKDYVAYLRKKYKGAISEIQFRDKSLLGWDMHIESFKTGKRKVYSKNYALLFSQGRILRDSCFNCKYTSLARTGDFTLADFWGIDKFFKGFNDNKGVSLLFVNSNKAEDLLTKEEILDGLEIKKCETYDFSQPNLKHPEKKPMDREKFWEEYNKYGLEYILNQYGMGNVKEKMRIYKSIFIIYIKRKVLKKTI